MVAIDFKFILLNDGLERFYTKPFLIPLLLLYFIVRTGPEWRTSRILIAFALIASFVGDFVLLFDTETDFIAGIAAFLIAHLFYISFFVRIQRVQQKTSGFIFIAAALVLAYMIYFLFLIWAAIAKNNLEFPVILYVLVIGMMMICAINVASGKLSSIAFLYFIPGALLFVISDSLLAYNKFQTKIPNASIEIMASYIAAQFLLVNGAVKTLKQKKSRHRSRD